MRFLRKYVLHSPVHYIAAVLLNSLLAFLILCLKGFHQWIYYVDAFSVAGAVSVLFGMLSWVASAGAFTTFGYAFSTFRSERRYRNLYEYAKAKEEKQAGQKKTFVHYIMVGMVFLLISFILSQNIRTR